MPLSGAPADPATAKDALRLRFAAARARRDAAGLARAQTRLGVASRTLPPAALVGAYVGVGTEPPTTDLLATLRATGTEVLLPVILPDGLLEWGALPADLAALGRGPLGLLEPAPPYRGQDAIARAELVLVPALAVDRSGNRLGRGRGYYDRALARLPSEAGPTVLAVVFDDELVDELPAEQHDRPVAGALTPSGLVMFVR